MQKKIPYLENPTLKKTLYKYLFKLYDMPQLSDKHPVKRKCPLMEIKLFICLKQVWQQEFGVDRGDEDWGKLENLPRP